MDGTTRVMISPALNQSDRLSSCSRAARRFLAKNPTSFNVFSFQTTDTMDGDDDAQELLLRYNIDGVHLDEAAFDKLRQEISLRVHNLQLPILWEREPVRLYSGVVPLPSGGFQKLVVREGRVAHVDPRTFAFKRWTDQRYYEACTSAEIYEYLEKLAAADVPALATLANRE
jgi:hypothetical protein